MISSDLLIIWNIHYVVLRDVSLTSMQSSTLTGFIISCYHVLLSTLHDNGYYTASWDTCNYGKEGPPIPSLNQETVHKINYVERYCLKRDISRERSSRAKSLRDLSAIWNPVSLQTLPWHLERDRLERDLAYAVLSKVSSEISLASLARSRSRLRPRRYLKRDRLCWWWRDLDRY